MPPIIKFTSVPAKNLYQSILATDYSFKINNIKGWDGADLTSAEFGVTGYAVFMNADKTRLEFFEWDPATIASASITITRRGLKFDGDRTTEVPANKLEWTANETTVLLGSDLSQIYQWLKDYIDQIAISGAPNATTILQGLVQLATQAQYDAKTGTGSTGAKLAVTPDLLRSTLYNDYVADTGAADAYVIAPSPAITAYAVGQKFTFKAANANTGTSTINVNGLGAKTIKINVTEDLPAGAILQDQIVELVYDGTNMQMVSNTLTRVFQKTYYHINTIYGSSTTQFNITNPSGTTFRYTWNSVGTNPNINTGTLPTGAVINIRAQSFNANNNGLFKVTASGNNYFEVTNPSGVIENNAQINVGIINRGYEYTKPVGLSQLFVQGIGGGAGGAGGGGSGRGSGFAGFNTYFGNCIAYGGLGGSVGPSGLGLGGIATGGDINSTGNAGGWTTHGSISSGGFGAGAPSFFGVSYGGGGNGATSAASGSGYSGGNGGGSGGYFEKMYLASSLSSPILFAIGHGGYKGSQGTYGVDNNQLGYDGIIILTEYFK